MTDINLLHVIGTGVPSSGGHSDQRIVFLWSERLPDAETHRRLIFVINYILFSAFDGW